MLPRLQIRTRKNADRKLLCVRHDHDPALRRRIPNHLWIAEALTPDINHRIACILLKCIPAVSRVRNLLRLGFGCVERVDGNDAVVLVGKEGGGVVCVQDSAAGEDALVRAGGVDGDGLVGPVVEVWRGGVAPVLVAGYG